MPAPAANDIPAVNVNVPTILNVALFNVPVNPVKFKSLTQPDIVTLSDPAVTFTDIALVTEPSVVPNWTVLVTPAAALPLIVKLDVPVKVNPVAVDIRKGFEVLVIALKILPVVPNAIDLVFELLLLNRTQVRVKLFKSNVPVVKVRVVDETVIAS